MAQRCIQTLGRIGEPRAPASPLDAKQNRNRNANTNTHTHGVVIGGDHPPQATRAGALIVAVGDDGPVGSGHGGDSVVAERDDCRKLAICGLGVQRRKKRRGGDEPS